MRKLQYLFIYSFILFVVALVAACSPDKPKPPLVPVDADADGDTDTDADSDGDADGDADNAFVGLACTPETALASCGEGLYCVDGVCCKDQCTGECASCAVPGYEGHCRAVEAGLECRVEASACDAVEVCDGVSPVCPADEMKPFGAQCGDAVDNDCDDPDTCDINGICQPNYAPPGGVCTDPSGYCKVNPLCNGEGLCTSDVNQPDAMACGSAEINECDTPDSCLAGVCEPNFIAAGTACGDVTTINECNLADSCDGAGLCSPNLLAAETPCGSQVEGECDLADQCDGTGLCDTRFLPDETACGDAANSECDKPDSCLTGVCATNLLPDGTVCNAGETTVAFRCSDTDCSATPQRQVVGWTCTTGACSEVITPTWEDIGAPCTVSQVCTTDGTTAAGCEECNEQQPNECIGKVATGYYPDGYCSLVAGTPACVYDEMAEDCTKNTDGNINCVAGLCSQYSCAPGEKDLAVTWNSDDEGWELGSWVRSSDWPWHQATGTIPYLRLTVTDDGFTEEEATAMSPAMELFACSTGTASFYFTMQDESAVCSPGTEIALECGTEGDWTKLWSVKAGAAYKPPVMDVEDALISDIDISPCFGKTELYFRFVVHNLCKKSVSFVAIDDFTITAVQDTTVDTNTPIDTGTGTPDTGTGTGIDPDTGTGTGVDTGTGTGIDPDTGTGTGVDTGTGTGIDPDTGTGTGVDTEPDTGTGVDTDVDTDTGLDTGVDTDTGIDTSL